jgi:hypothetical protein
MVRSIEYYYEKMVIGTGCFAIGNRKHLLAYSIPT